MPTFLSERHPPLGDVEGARVVVEHVGNANFQTFLSYALPEGASAYCTFRCWKAGFLSLRLNSKHCDPNRSHSPSRT